jgi:hypothetical protein
MRQYVVGAMVGGLLGFLCQFVGDNVFLHPYQVNQAGACEWIPGGSSQFNYYRSGNLARYVARRIPVQGYQAEGHQLIYQIMLLAWLRDRGDIAGRTAAWTAFLGASAVLAGDQLQKTKRKNAAVA